MPNNIRVIHARDFISATPRGEFDLASSKKLLEAVAATAAQQQHDVILDIRDARSNMTAADLWALASALAGDRKSFSKMAILCPIERFDRAWFFVQCADNQHLNLRAFTDYEAAMKWLYDYDG